MTKKELYTCDICHTDYREKADARYNAHFNLPCKIEVEFSDGTKHWYRQ